MKKLTEKQIIDYIQTNISQFHSRRLDSIKKLKLKTVLKRKNPYLFKSKNMLTAYDLVRSIVDAYLSSQEETIFGEFLEGLAVYINSVELGGRKSAVEGIDLEFEKNDVLYLVSIKSGPNWGNSSQVKKMLDQFTKAKRILQTNTKARQTIFVNGCCYGKAKKPDKGNYLKLCGQDFWSLISDDKDLYLKIIEPLGHEAKKKNDKVMEEYSALLNRMTEGFSKEFCSDGHIDWNSLVRYVSQSETGLLI
jgi:hypothetical protein